MVLYIKVCKALIAISVLFSVYYKLTVQINADNFILCRYDRGELACVAEKSIIEIYY